MRILESLIHSAYHFERYLAPKKSNFSLTFKLIILYAETF